jgi:N-glycosylase/DNA lyase
MTCNVDICDGCTSRDARNAFLLWPRREFHRSLQHIEHLAKESRRAREYLQALKDDPDKTYLETMSKLCRKLAEIQTLKKEIDEEVKNKVHEKKVKTFAVLAREMY